MKKSLLIILTLGLLSFFSSCNFNFDSAYGTELGKALREKYEAEEIRVKVGNKADLTVTLINSPLEELSADEKHHLAREIGALALSLEKKPSLETGKLTFVEETELVITTFTESNTFDMYLKGEIIQ